MRWQVYSLVFRLRSPLHVGESKVGNLQRTRPYVTGRALWGALTMRLTRMAFHGKGPAINSNDYQHIGERLHQTLGFTYFYPALRTNGDFQVVWPWEDEDNFRRRFLSSYASTALSYPQQAAAEATLHEVEFISPTALDNGEPVYLVGYFFEKDGCDLEWEEACRELQLGGERGYGFGRVELVRISDPQGPGTELFGGQIQFKGGDDQPVIHVHVPASKQTLSRLLSHTLANEVSATGEVEPLVGREWRSNDQSHRYAGQYLAFTSVCFIPGSIMDQSGGVQFKVEKFGIWQLDAHTD